MSGRESNAGFTLLELTLSLALGTALIMGFFVGYKTLLQSINLAANGLRGPAEGAEVVSLMVKELDQATSVDSIQTDGFHLHFFVGAREVWYRLAKPSSPTASQDVFIERSEGNGSGPWTKIGPRRLIGNYHPYPGPLLDGSGNMVTGYQPVPFIQYNPAGGGQSATVALNLVLQSLPEATASYVRGLSTPRAIL